MKIIYNHKKFLLFFVLVCFLISLHYFIGFFLVDYEVFFNYAVQLAAHHNLTPIIASSDNFLLYPLYVFFQKLLPSIPIYALVKLSLIFLSVYIILDYFIFSIERKIYSIFFILIFTLVFSRSLILLHNTSIGFLLCFASFIVLFTDQKNRKRNLLFFYLLIVIAITHRIHISIIASFIGLLLLLLFYPKSHKLKHVIAFFGISVLSYIFFLFLALNGPDNLTEYVKYERALLNNQNFVIDKSPFDPSLNTKELKYFAKALFLNDKELDNINFKSIIEHESIFSYVFQNKDFVKIYVTKVKELILLIYNTNLPFLILIFLNTILSLFIFKTKQLPFIILNLIFCITLLFLTVFTTLNEEIIYPFFGLNILVSLICFYNLTHNAKWFNIICFYTLILLLWQGLYNIEKILTYKNDSIKQQKFIEKSIKRDALINQKSVFTYLNYEGVLPSKIVKNNNNLYNQIVYLDYGTLNKLPLFTKINQKIFGKNNNNLLFKYQWLIENNEGYIYSDEFMKDFITLYLKKIHNYHIKFELIEGFEDFAIKKYKIHQIEQED